MLIFLSYIYLNLHCVHLSKNICYFVISVWHEIFTLLLLITCYFMSQIVLRYLGHMKEKTVLVGSRSQIDIQCSLTYPDLTYQDYSLIRTPVWELIPIQLSGQSVWDRRCPDKWGSTVVCFVSFHKLMCT